MTAPYQRELLGFDPLPRPPLPYPDARTAGSKMQVTALCQAPAPTAAKTCPEKRRQMVEDWAAWCRPAKSKKVVSLVRKVTA